MRAVLQGLSEEEVQAAANAAAQDAASEASALVKQAVGEGGDAQSHYYKLAHRCGAASVGFGVLKDVMGLVLRTCRGAVPLLQDGTQVTARFVGMWGQRMKAQ